MEEVLEFELPFCFIPENISENYSGLVKKFFETDGKQQVENFAKEIEKKYNLKFKILHWHPERGLNNISFLQSGLDLDEYCYKYTFHNIYPGTDYEKAAFEVAKKYIKILKDLSNKINKKY